MLSFTFYSQVSGVSQDFCCIPFKNDGQFYVPFLYIWIVSYVLPAFAAILEFILSCIVAIWSLQLPYEMWQVKNFLDLLPLCTKLCFNCRHIDSSYVIIMWQASI